MELPGKDEYQEPSFQSHPPAFRDLLNRWLKKCIGIIPSFRVPNPPEAGIPILRRRRPLLILASLAAQACLTAAVHSQPPPPGRNLASLVYLDGKNVENNAQIYLRKDQLVILEMYDLQPNSQVKLTLPKSSPRPTRRYYQTDERGSMKEILFFPRAQSPIRCMLRFVTRDGASKHLVFHLKPIWDPALP
ncbi:MAG: hypothetical protein RLZZ165_1289 [Bacteroidota bacterium]|jgi:hypothetical protein